MEGSDGTVVINTNPNAIKVAQEEMGKLDVLVCGLCHSVFHFIEEFKEHRSKEGACSQVSHFREKSHHESKAQVWAFLLWKDTQINQEGIDKDSSNSWKLYQKWCKMDTHIRDSWITAGKTIQTFTKISNAKMQEVPRHNQGEDTKTTMIVRKVIRNGQPEELTEKKEMISVGSSAKMPDLRTQKPMGSEVKIERKDKPKLKPSIKPKAKIGKVGNESKESDDDEYVVEKILAKRFNPKKKCSEYLMKWEGYAHEYNTWESFETVSACKQLLDEFEKNLAKQKELKAAAAAAAAANQQQNVNKIISRTITIGKDMKADIKAGPSTAPQAGRPMRSSKSKAMDQVKQWCGSMQDEESELLGKRKMDSSESDSEAGGAAKRTKGETGSDEEWTGDSEDERILGRSDVIQRAFNRANVQSNGANKTVLSTADLAATLGLQSPETMKSGQPPVLVANAKGVVKVDPKQMPNLTSGVYVMSRKEGIIKLDSSPSGKLAVKGSPAQGVLMVQNRDNSNIIRKQVITANQANTMTPVKMITKVDGNQLLTPVKVVSKPVVTKVGSAQKNEPVKIQPKPEPTQLQQIHVVTTPITLQPRITQASIRPVAGPVAVGRGVDTPRPLMPRPALRTATPTSILGIGTIRTQVRAPTPKVIPGQLQQQPRQSVPRRSLTQVSPTTTSNLVTPTKTKYPVLGVQSQKPVPKPGTSPIQKQSPKNFGNKPQSLLSPQQKLLMAKRKAQEAVGLVSKTSGRGLLAGARVVGRGRAKIPDSPNTISPGNKPKESKLAQGDGLHMEFHEVHSEESSSEGEPDIAPPDPEAVMAAVVPDSPPRPFTLCPLTGRIMGPDGEPMETQTTEPESETPTTPIVKSTIENTLVSTSVTAASPEVILPTLDSLTEGGGIMRVEMSPGGTTGTVVQASESSTQISLSNVIVPAPDLPCLDDTTTTSIVAATSSAAITTNTNTGITTLTESVKTGIESASTAALITGTSPVVASNVTSSDIIKIEDKSMEEKKMSTEDTSNLVTITGEDGVVYQVAGQAEDGQTLLVTRGADGEQQCVYVTTEQQGDEGSVLTLDHAVAEAVAQLMPDQVNLASQFYVKEGDAESTENPMVMSIMDSSASGDVHGAQEDADGQAQVVAQVVQAEEPTPGGTRRVVLLLPDGNLMMTEVDEEQYAALELDK